MYMTSYGAAREVTGSMHLLTTDHDHILLDCGLFQGRRRESQGKNRVLPFDPKILTNVVLSHAHIDHTGRVPMLMAGGTFAGRVICTRVTADACHYLLMDSAKIQESDAEYLNYKTVRAQLHRLASSKRKEKLSKSEKRKIHELLKKNRHHLNVTKIEELIAKYRLEKVEPLYTSSDAEFALEHFDGYPYRHPVTIGRNMTCTFYEAGHILGSSLVKIRARENGREYTIMFTGDIGRFDKPILRDPFRGFAEEDRDVDLLLMESTYGNRTHAPVKDIKPQLAEVIRTTRERGGSVIIPAFAYGRTQELIYTIHEIYDDGEAPRMPIYVDSPLASKITKVFAEHPEVYDEQAHETFLEKGKNPFAFEEMQFVKSVEESMALNREKKPHIVISASGMCEAGRILHHLRHKIHNPNNTILIVGFMARNTLGRKILEEGRAYAEAGRKGDPPLLRFYNKEYPLKAEVVELGGFSAHADRDEMLRFLKESHLRPKKISIIHGEEDQSLAFSEFLAKEGYSVVVPRCGETLTIG